MSEEFFLYTLIIIVTLSMSLAFGFIHKKVIKLEQKYKRALEIIAFLNNNVKNIKRGNSSHRSNFSYRKNEIISGDLTIIHNGEQVNTKAVFKVD